MRFNRGTQIIGGKSLRIVSPCAWQVLWLVLLASNLHQTCASTISFWGTTSPSTNIPPSLTNAVAISAGSWHSLALLSDGSVTSWGNETNMPSGLSNVVAISAGGSANLALKENGTLVSWGTSSYGQTNLPVSATNVVAISAGSSHCLALRHDGSVVAWGTNNFNQTNVPSSATNLASISAGGAHSAVLRRDGAVICWGLNDRQQVSGIPNDLSNVAAVTAGGAHTLALHHDGSHSYWGVVVNYPGPIYSNAPTGFTNVVSVSAGSLHTASLLSDGTVHTDGYPPTTTQPPDLSNVVAVAASQNAISFLSFGVTYQGSFYSLALVGDGNIHALSAPKQHTLVAGSFLILTPMATGPQPLHYQWRLNDTNLPGASETQFVISKANRRSAGDYSVIISNSTETVTSQVAHVSVIVRQRLEPGGMDETGSFTLWSGDEDGTELTTNDINRFTLESSPDCSTWTSQTATPSLTNGLLRFVDPNATSSTNRYYRIREVE